MWSQCTDTHWTLLSLGRRETYWLIHRGLIWNRLDSLIKELNIKSCQIFHVYGIHKKYNLIKINVHYDYSVEALNANVQMILPPYLERNRCDCTGLSTTWCVIVSSDSQYVAPQTPPTSSQDTTPPKQRITKVKASRGTSLDKKNWYPSKSRWSFRFFSSSFRALFRSSSSSGYVCMCKYIQVQ